MRGMGRTFAFVPRARGMRGMGDASTDIDFATGLPCDDPRANCAPVAPTFDPGAAPAPLVLTPPPGPAMPTLPPSFFTNPSPAAPPRSTTTNVPPVIGPAVPTVPPGIQIVFPSQGSTATAKAAAPATSWLDQQMIAGVPNTYLALGVVGLVLFLSVSGAKRRR
jgi:hypothetical protein